MRSTFIIALALAAALPALAGNGRDATTRKVRYATEVVQNRMTSAFPIPENVIDASKCLAALKVVKAGFIWGGEGSTGMVSCRIGDHWSAPSFFNTGGVSFGIQIGVQFLESVLMFMTDKAREILEHGTVELGADITFAAGPVGGGGGGGVIPEAGVLTYNRSKGLFAGASVGGFILTHDRPRNQQVYGSDAPPASIFLLDGSKAPDVVQPFVKTLEKFVPLH